MMSSSWNFMCCAVCLMIHIIRIICTHTHSNKCIPLTVLTFQNYTRYKLLLLFAFRVHTLHTESAWTICKIYIFHTFIWVSVYRLKNGSSFVLSCTKWKRIKTICAALSTEKLFQTLIKWQKHEKYCHVPIFWKWWLLMVIVAHAMNKFVDTTHAWLWVFSINEWIEYFFFSFSQLISICAILGKNWKPEIRPKRLEQGAIRICLQFIKFVMQFRLIWTAPR